LIFRLCSRVLQEALISGNTNMDSNIESQINKDIVELVKEVPGGKAFLDFIERSEVLSHTKTRSESR